MWSLHIQAHNGSPESIVILQETLDRVLGTACCLICTPKNTNAFLGNRLGCLSRQASYWGYFQLPYACSSSSLTACAGSQQGWQSKLAPSEPIFYFNSLKTITGSSLLCFYSSKSQMLAMHGLDPSLSSCHFNVAPPLPSYRWPCLKERMPHIVSLNLYSIARHSCSG